MSYNHAAIDAVRRRLQRRLGVLEANQDDLAAAFGTPDTAMEVFEGQQALDWLVEPASNPRGGGEPAPKSEKATAGDTEAGPSQGAVQSKAAKPAESKGAGGRLFHFDEETLFLFVSSDTRDRDMWPNAANFRVTLNEEVDNIIKAELVQASIPLVDPTVHQHNQAFRYAFAPFAGLAAVRTVRVPTGSYRGDELARELQVQLNLDWHAARITSATNTMNFTTGFLVDALGAVEPAIEQFMVTYHRAINKFAIQVVDSALQPTSTAFAIHVQPQPNAPTSLPARERTDDIYHLLGIDRYVFEEQADGFDPDLGTFYIVNTSAGNSFCDGVAAIDARFRGAVRSNQSADLRGTLVMIIDIDPLNDNDILRLDDGGMGAVNLTNYFGIVLLRDPSFVNDRIVEVNTNSYPVRKYYRETRSRVKDLNVALRRMDGSIVDFQGVDFFLTIRLTTKRVNHPKPMLVR